MNFKIAGDAKLIRIHHFSLSVRKDRGKKQRKSFQLFVDTVLEVTFHDVLAG
jgi:hypothetical protein